jgi:transcriptional regulator with XRE-family HTH domain
MRRNHKFNGRLLQDWRLGQGLSQTDLAKRAGVSTPSVSSWERGHRPQPRHLLRLARITGISINVFLSIGVPDTARHGDAREGGK